MINTVADLIAELQTVDLDSPVELFDGAEASPIEVTKMSHWTYSKDHVWIQKRFDPELAHVQTRAQLAEADREFLEVQEKLYANRRRLKQLAEYSATLREILHKKEHA